jgi:uncharacterized membrane protein
MKLHRHDHYDHFPPRPARSTQPHRRIDWVGLGLALSVGLILRFLNLTGKPLWMDEVITAIFGFGQTYDVIPTGLSLSVADLTQFFTLQPQTTCTEIATNVMVQSVHPPLFFCAMHQWLRLFQSTGLDWVWQLRSLAAIVGTASIGLVYYITRVAFQSPRAALLSAWVMAVSPFAVYLSQEARHYTLPMFVIMAGLLGLIKIQQDWQQNKINPIVWVGWAACQTLGFYIHYFCLLATIGQVGALILWQWRYQRSQPCAIPSPWIPVAFSISAIGFTFVPWLPIFISHIGRPETNWMKSSQSQWFSPLAPIGQLVGGWLSMIVAFPVEQQPLIVIIPTTIAMGCFGLWILQQAQRGYGRIYQATDTREATFILSSFLAIVVGIFLVVIFGLGKDISQVPRYNFVYYPAVVMLLAASLDRQQQSTPTPFRISAPFYVILIGCLSSLFVNANLVFLKAYMPDQIADRINRSGPAPQIVMAYDSYQELALGTSFTLALKTVNPAIKFTFLDRSSGYDAVFKNLPNLPNSLNFWLIAPGLRQRDFPPLLSVGQKRCTLMPDRYFRLGIPYQGYKCQ